MLTLCALEHLVVAGIAVACEVTDVSDVHNALDVKTCEAEILLENVLHNVASEVADMGKMVNGRAAGVHTYLAGFIWDKLLFFM